MSLQVVIVGGGMICNDQILPSLYHLQRLGVVGEIQICGRRAAPVKALAEAPELRAAFPGQRFTPFPDLSADTSKTFPDLYQQVIAKMPRRNLAIIATPDPLHYEMVKCAMEHDQHVLAVKPLVLQYQQALEIERLAHAKGLFVGVEYHKRFDRRSLEARRSYREGRFGQFRCGEAKLVEPWYYRHSNFQSWFTCENTDPFTYIGCHYVDLVWFITGLKPVEVSVQGVKGSFPNGNVGFLWSAGRVRYENDAVLSVINGLGYPDQGAGSNHQGMCLFCEGGDSGGLIQHDDQFRGVAHSYTDGKLRYPFRFISPDYFRLVPWQGEGLKPVGYGYDSIEAYALAAQRINQESSYLRGAQALAKQQAILDEIDAAGLLATPKNSSINEQVIEAARHSILDGGKLVVIRP